MLLWTSPLLHFDGAVMNTQSKVRALSNRPREGRVRTLGSPIVSSAPPEFSVVSSPALGMHKVSVRAILRDAGGQRPGRAATRYVCRG